MEPTHSACMLNKSLFIRGSATVVACKIQLNPVPQQPILPGAQSRSTLPSTLNQ